MTYTRDKLTAKLVGMIEPMPTDNPEHGIAPWCPYSPKEAWIYSLPGNDGHREWIINRAIKPLDDINDTIRCAEAKYGPNCWELQSTPHKRIAYIWAGDTPAEWRAWDYWYTDNDHALALALALASAVDGERAGVTG